MATTSGYRAARDRYGRQVNYLVALELDRCANQYGISGAVSGISSVCQASQLADGARCFFTFPTCQDKDGFVRTTKTHYFSLTDHPAIHIRDTPVGHVYNPGFEDWGYTSGVNPEGLEPWLWLDNDSLIGAAVSGGEPLAQWLDSSLYGRNFGQGVVDETPTYIEEAINFRPAVQFDGNQFLELTNTTDALQGAFSMWVVAASDGASQKDDAAIFTASQEELAVNAPATEALLHFASGTNTHSDVGISDGDGINNIYGPIVSGRRIRTKIKPYAWFKNNSKDGNGFGIFVSNVNGGGNTGSGVDGDTQFLGFSDDGYLIWDTDTLPRFFFSGAQLQYGQWNDVEIVISGNQSNGVGPLVFAFINGEFAGSGVTNSADWGGGTHIAEADNFYFCNPRTGGDSFRGFVAGLVIERQWEWDRYTGQLEDGGYVEPYPSIYAHDDYNPDLLYSMRESETDVSGIVHDSRGTENNAKFNADMSSAVERQDAETTTDLSLMGLQQLGQYPWRGNEFRFSPGDDVGTYTYHQRNKWRLIPQEIDSGGFGSTAKWGVFETIINVQSGLWTSGVPQGDLIFVQRHAPGGISGVPVINYEFGVNVSGGPYLTIAGFNGTDPSPIPGYPNGYDVLWCGNAPSGLTLSGCAFFNDAVDVRDGQDHHVLFYIGQHGNGAGGGQIWGARCYVDGVLYGSGVFIGPNQAGQDWSDWNDGNAFCATAVDGAGSFDWSQEGIPAISGAMTFNIFTSNVDGVKASGTMYQFGFHEPYTVDWGFSASGFHNYLRRIPFPMSTNSTQDSLIWAALDEGFGYQVGTIAENPKVWDESGPAWPLPLHDIAEHVSGAAAIYNEFNPLTGAEEVSIQDLWDAGYTPWRWYDTESLSGLDIGDRVIVWPDKGPNNYFLSGYNGVNNCPNVRTSNWGKRYVHMDTGSDYALRYGDENDALRLAGEYTVIMVYEFGTGFFTAFGNDDDAPGGFGSDSNDGISVPTSPNHHYCINYLEAQGSVGTQSSILIPEEYGTEDGQLYVVVIRRDANNKHWIQHNGYDVSLPNRVDATSLNFHGIFTFDTDSRSGAGAALAELAILEGDIGAENARKLHNHLAKKWKAGQTNRDEAAFEWVNVNSPNFLAGSGNALELATNLSNGQSPEFNYGSGLSTGQLTTDTVGSGFVIHTIQRDADGNHHYFINGTEFTKSPAPNAVSDDWTPYALAAVRQSNGVFDGGYKGKVAEVIIFNEELSGTNLVGVEAFLRNRYGLPQEPRLDEWEVGGDPTALIESTLYLSGTEYFQFSDPDNAMDILTNGFATVSQGTSTTSLGAQGIWQFSGVSTDPKIGFIRAMVGVNRYRFGGPLSVEYKLSGQSWTPMTFQLDDTVGGQTRGRGSARRGRNRNGPKVYSSERLSGVSVDFAEVRITAGAGGLLGQTTAVYDVWFAEDNPDIARSRQYLSDRPGAASNWVFGITRLNEDPVYVREVISGGLQPGEYYRVSAWCKCDATTTSGFRMSIQNLNTGDYVTSGGVQWSGTNVPLILQPTTSGQWHQFTTAFKISGGFDIDDGYQVSLDGVWPSGSTMVYDDVSIEGPIQIGTFSKPYVARFIDVPQKIDLFRGQTEPRKVKVQMNFDYQPKVEDKDKWLFNSSTAGEYWRNMLARHRNYDQRPARIYRGFGGLEFGDYKLLSDGRIISWKTDKQGAVIETLDKLNVGKAKVPQAVSDDNIIITSGTAGLNNSDTILRVTSNLQIPNPVEYSGLDVIIEIGGPDGFDGEDDINAPVEYAVVTAISGNNDEEYLIVDRGRYGTSAQTHPDPELNGGIRWRNVWMSREEDGGGTTPMLAMDTVQELLKWAQIDEDDINSDSFTNTQTEYYPGLVFDRTITKPQSIKTLLKEIREVLTLAIFINREHKIAARILGPPFPTEIAAELNDDQHLIVDSVTLDDDPSRRITRALLFYAPNEEDAGSDPNKYDKNVSRVDLELEAAVNYGTAKEQVIFSQWFKTDESPDVLAGILRRRIDILKYGLRTMKFRLEVKDGDLDVGDFANITTQEVLDAFGVPVELPYLVTSRKSVNENIMEYEAVNAQGLRGRVLRIGPNTMADTYAAAGATDLAIGYWSDNNGEIENDSGGRDIGYTFF